MHLHNTFIVMHGKRFPFVSLGRVLFFLRNFLNRILFLFLKLLRLFFLILFSLTFNVSVFSIHLFQKHAFDIFDFLMEVLVFLVLVFSQVADFFFKSCHFFIDLFELLFNVFEENYFLDLPGFADFNHLSHCFLALIDFMHLLLQ